MRRNEAAESLIPNPPQNTMVRELYHGIMLKNPAHLIPVGAGIDVKNFDVSAGGLRRVSSWQARNITFLPYGDDSLAEADLVFTDQNQLEVMFFGNKFLYKLNVDGSELERVSFGLTFSDAITPASAVWNNTDKHWELNVPVGFSVQTAGRGDALEFGGEVYLVANQFSNKIAFTSDLDTALSPITVTDFSVAYAFLSRAPYKFDYEAIPGNLYWVDRSPRSLIAYNLSLGVREIPFSATKEISEINSVGYHDFRLWLGGMTIDGTRHPNRILWSKRSSPLAPAIQVIEDETYFLDLIGPKTEILRMLSLGSLFVIYFADGIFFGRPTNIVGLPYDFEFLNTGGLGLAGQRAICSLADGHYFVGRDDVYFFSAGGSLEKIGSEVLKRTIEVYQDALDQTVVVADPKNSRILFGFKELGADTFSEVWIFNYEFKAWTWMDIRGSGMTQVSFILSETWDSFYEGNDDPSITPPVEFQWDAPRFSDVTWEQFKPSENLNQLFLISNNRLYVPTQSLAYCENRGAVPEVLYESGDIDFGMPDDVKTTTRLTIKIETPLTRESDQVGDDVSVLDDDNLTFYVEISSSRGQRWKNSGILRIRTGQDEGKLNFTITGSLFRFRLRSSSRVRKFRIVECGIRARIGGLETLYS